MAAALFRPSPRDELSVCRLSGSARAPGAA